MTAALSIFRFDGADVRTVVIDGEPWFVLSDLCALLGVGNARDVAARLAPDQKGVGQIDTLGGRQNMTIVNESGMYEVVIRSDKPEAVRVRRWITNDVLPAIRRTGTYSTAPALPQSYADALRELASAVEQREVLAAKVAVDAPKVAYVDEFVAPDDVILFKVAAAQLGLSEPEFRDRLVAAKWCYRHRIGARWSQSQQRTVEEFEWRAYANHADKFSMKPQHNAPRHHNGQVRQTLYIHAAAMPMFKLRFGQMEVAS